MPTRVATLRQCRGGGKLPTAKSGRTRLRSALSRPRQTRNLSEHRPSCRQFPDPLSGGMLRKRVVRTRGPNEESETATRTLSGMHEGSSQEKSPREAEEGSLTSGRISSGTSRSFGGFRHISLGTESSGLFMNLT